jgi:transcriptional regulator with XRE-family HTH domain
MNFSQKLKAARALLNWTQEQLAEVADVSIASVRKIETDETIPTGRTQAKILRVLEKQGITFTAKGLEKNDFPIYFTQGDNHEEAYLKLLEDAFEHLKEVKNPELLIMYADDRVSPPSVNNIYRKMRSEGIKMRQLIEEGNTYIIGPLNEYRYVPKGFFINRVTLVYGDRIANETSDACQGVIRVDPINARIQRNTFDILWKVLEQPRETTSDERF